MNWMVGPIEILRLLSLAYCTSQLTNNHSRSTTPGDNVGNECVHFAMSGKLDHGSISVMYTSQYEVIKAWPVDLLEIACGYPGIVVSNGNDVLERTSGISIPI